MKKKKGFTLIEVVVAIAVLSIAMVGIGSAMYTGTSISVKNSKKIDSSVFAQNVIQTYKSKGKESVEDLFELKSKPSRSGYCYFNDESQLAGILENAFSSSSHSPISNFIDGSQDDMLTGNGTYNKKFGAYIEVKTTRELGLDSDNTPKNLTLDDLVSIRIYVASLQGKPENHSSLVFYMGR